MGFFTEFAIQAGLQILGDSFAPKPSTPDPAPIIDTGALTTENLANIQAGKSAIQLQSEQRVQKNASELSAGRVPKDVQDMITQRAAETANQVGLSAVQSRNLQLRDLGLSSLDALKAGAGLQTQIDSQRNAEQAQAYNQAVDTANQTYDAYAIQEQAKVRADNLKQQRHANLVKSIGGLVANSYSDYKEKTRFDSLMALQITKNEKFTYIPSSSDNAYSNLFQKDFKSPSLQLGTGGTK